MTHFDVLVIGTGSGNSILDDRFANLRVAIAEPSLFGGTCLNAGCIPTKMYVHVADVARQSTDSEDLGLQTEFHAADWPAIRDRVFARIDEIESAGRHYRSEELENTTVLTEHLRFTGTHSLVGDSGSQVTADRIVIAAGAHPVVPDIPGLDPALVDAPGSPVHTSRSIMRVADRPDSVLVLGSGYIAAEFAHIFTSIGTDTTVAVRGEGRLATWTRRSPPPTRPHSPARTTCGSASRPPRSRSPTTGGSGSPSPPPAASPQPRSRSRSSWTACSSLWAAIRTRQA